MISMGQKLYEAWQQAMSDEGVLVDPWSEVPPTEQAAWEAVGDQVVFT